MQADLTAMRRRRLLPVRLGLGGLPLLLALDGHALPARIWAAPVVLLIYLLAAWGCLRVPGKRRFLAAGAGAVVLTAACLLICGGQPGATDLLQLALCLVLLAVTLPLAAQGRGLDVSPAIPVACGVAYLLVYAAADLGLWDIVPEVRAAFDALLLGGFLLFMYLTLLQLGATAMDSAAASGKVPEALRRRTNVLVTALMLLVTLISALPVLKRWFDAFTAGVVLVVLRVMDWLAHLLGGESTGAGGGGGGGMDLSELGEAAAPSPLAVFLEKVAMAVALLLALVLLALLLRQLWRVLKKAVLHLLALLRQYTAAASEDYVDEVASTLDDVEHEDAARMRRARRARRRVDERTLTPAELVRWRYQQLRSRHAEWGDAATARDTLPASAAEAYERARYSTHPVGMEDAGKFDSLK